eukprot:6045309-Amphidinium_carterae.2
MKTATATAIDNKSSEHFPRFVRLRGEGPRPRFVLLFGMLLFYSHLSSDYAEYMTPAAATCTSQMDYCTPWGNSTTGTMFF